MSAELALIRQGFNDRIARTRRIIARATPWPFAVRVVVFVAALAAEAFAYPLSVVTGTAAIFVLILAALPALWPRTAAVSVFWLVTVAGWVAASALFADVATLPRLVGLTVCLYLVHSGAALAAVLPYDAVVEPTVVLRWALRAALVVAVAVGVGVGALFAANRIPPRSFLAATLVGMALTVALGWVLTLAVRRR